MSWEGDCAFKDGDDCKVHQKHDSSRVCDRQNCTAYTDERMVARYFRCVICPTCSKYDKCWTVEQYLVSAGPQGFAEEREGKLCHNLCNKAPSPQVVDLRYGTAGA
jgi:hypothetical protein